MFFFTFFGYLLFFSNRCSLLLPIIYCPRDTCTAADFSNLLLCFLLILPLSYIFNNNYCNRQYSSCQHLPYDYIYIWAVCSSKLEFDSDQEWFDKIGKHPCGKNFPPVSICLMMPNTKGNRQSGTGADLEEFKRRIRLKWAYYNRRNETKRNSAKYCEILRNSANYEKIWSNNDKEGLL